MLATGAAFALAPAMRLVPRPAEVMTIRGAFVIGPVNLRIDVVTEAVNVGLIPTPAAYRLKRYIYFIDDVEATETQFNQALARRWGDAAANG